MRNSIWSVFAVVFLALGGCANQHSIFRTFDLSDESAITDAKQRAVISAPASGNIGVNEPDFIVCAEPSPDVAQAISTSLSVAVEASLQSGNDLGAQGALAISESIAQLGERLATVQLLRDGLYRLCEAYSNGAVSDATYAMIVSGIDDVMVAMLASEIAGGAFGRPLAGISGSADADAGQAALTPENAQKVQMLLGEITMLETSIAEQEVIIAQSEAEDEKAAKEQAERQKAKDQAALEGKMRELDSLTSLAVSTSASGTVQTANLARGSNQAGAQAIVDIHSSFTHSDSRDLAAFVKACAVTLDRSAPNRPAGVNDGMTGTIGRTYNRLPRSAMTEVCEGLFQPVGGELPLAKLMQARHEHGVNLAKIRVYERLAEAMVAYGQRCPDENLKAQCDAMQANLSSLSTLLDENL